MSVREAGVSCSRTVTDFAEAQRQHKTVDFNVPTCSIGRQELQRVGQRTENQRCVIFVPLTVLYTFIKLLLVVNIGQSRVLAHFAVVLMYENKVDVNLTALLILYALLTLEN